MPASKILFISNKQIARAQVDIISAKLPIHQQKSFSFKNVSVTKNVIANQ